MSIKIIIIDNLVNKKQTSKIKWKGDGLKKVQRANGAKTRQKILDVATQLFVSKGFGATSLLEIAKAVGINHSLIFHHFGSKEALWKAAKQSLIDLNESEQLESPRTTEGLRAFLEDVIIQRFQFCRNNPDILRLIEWQRLEDNDNELMGGTSFSPDSWRKAIIDLQKQGEIKPELDPDGVCLILMCSLYGAFSNYRRFSSKQKKQKAYIDMLIDCFCVGLAPVKWQTGMKST